MSSTNLFAMARSKLSRTPSGDSKDSFSLHRWVLLKNSIFQSLSSSSSANTAAATPLPDDDGDDDTDADSFMFPDAGKLMQGISTEAAASEAAWLDSLLETLGEDDDDEADTSVSVVPVDDDEELPPISPMSSSDDLHCYPFLVPYPPYSPPPSLPHIYSTAPYVDPLPYCDFDDFEDLPVPDAVEDTASDDESDAPPTPAQSLSSLTLDPASIPLPPEHSRLRHSSPHIYISDDDEDFFYPFDPLPFAYNHPPPSLDYTEC